jgi:arsenite oxidase small subunit
MSDTKDKSQQAGTPVSRRSFLKLSSSMAAGAATLGTGMAQAATKAPAAEVGRATLPYEPKVVAHRSSLKTNEPVAFNFPDKDSPCTLIKIGRSVPGGVGPDRDIVAYSTQCTHMGCQLAYDKSTATFRCGCHYSVFDAEMAGQMVCGQATEDLPKVTLEYDDKSGTVTAVAVQGLIYGRQANLL